MPHNDRERKAQFKQKPRILPRQRRQAKASSKGVKPLHPQGELYLPQRSQRVPLKKLPSERQSQPRDQAFPASPHPPPPVGCRSPGKRPPLSLSGS